MTSNDSNNNNSGRAQPNDTSVVESPTNPQHILNFRRASMPVTHSLHKSAHFSTDSNSPSVNGNGSPSTFKAPPSRLTIRRSSLTERVPTPIPPFVAPDVEIPKEMLKQQLKQFSYLPSNYTSSDGSQPRPSTPIPSEDAIKHKLKLFQMLNRRNLTLEEEYQAQQQQRIQKQQQQTRNRQQQRQEQQRTGQTGVATVDSSSSESDDDLQDDDMAMMGVSAATNLLMDPKLRHELVIESMYREPVVGQEEWKRPPQ